jgi:hypothetical protein
MGDPLIEELRGLVGVAGLLEEGGEILGGFGVAATELGRCSTTWG